MITSASDIFAKTRKIEIRTSRLVNELFGGRYHSSFKGRGMEFVDVREYVPGDDVRTVHWNITARLGTPYVKRFVEERELTIMIVVDVSGSNQFGTRGRFKSELAAELASVLTLAALKNNDKVGLLLFSDKIESYLPPRKSKRHALRIVRDVLTAQHQGRGTDINAALQYLNRVQKKKAIVFVISDFLDKNFERSLRITHRHHDTIALILDDPMEANWPPVARVLIEDAESGEKSIAPAGRKRFLDTYARMQSITKAERERFFKRINLDHVNFTTNGDYVRPLLGFFREREKRRR